MFDSAIYQTDYGTKSYTFVGSQVNLYYIDLSNQVFSFCCYGSDTHALLTTSDFTVTLAYSA